MNFNYQESLIRQLKVLKNKYNLYGIKSEFEAEGSAYIDISRLRSLTRKLNIKLFVKIGGVEALNDIYNCLEMDVDGIIAPMVETKFGVKKFVDIFEKLKLKKNPHLTINVETKRAIDNLNEILKFSAGKIKNITIGRSDLAASYFNKKINPNSDFILNKIKYVGKTAKKYNLSTTVGGSVNSETIKKYSKDKEVLNLLEKIETRKVMLPTRVFLKKKFALNNSLKFEEIYIMQKKELYDMKLSPEILRLSNLNTRK